MRWCLSTAGYAEYILPVTLSTSVTTEFSYNCHRSLIMYLVEHAWDALGDGYQVNSEMHWEMEIEWTQRCTWKPWLSEFGYALGNWDRVNSEMQLEARIRHVSRCTWRQWSCKLAGSNRASLEIHLEAEIEWTQNMRVTLWSIKFADALWGCDRASLEINLQAMIERDWRSTCRQLYWREAWRQLGIYSLVNL
jgi:hypothetical protein